MKRFFTLCMILGLVLPFAGCDKKKAEVKTETTVTTPEGTTTTTDSQKVETTAEPTPK
jgi:PBP1b-binding outer membrane lipoprotein LpoB